MDYKKLYLVLKITLILVLIVLMFTIQKYKTSDCAYCSFQVEDEVLNFREFISLYFEECLEENTTALLIIPEV